MSWNDKVFFAIAVAIYGLGMFHAFFLWRRGFRRDDWVLYGVLALGMVLHTVAMAKRGFSLHRCPVNNLYEATAFVMWAIVSGYLVMGLWPRLRFLGAFVSPLLFALGVFAMMPALDAQPQFTGGIVSLHVALIALAYGALGLSFGGSLMYLSQEHDLKFDKLRAIISRLPAIQQLERVMVRLMFCGIVLLTAGLAVSFLGMKAPHGQSFLQDPKVIWSLAVWLFYVGLLVWYRRADHGGHRLAWGNLLGFAFVLLTFWGVNLLSKIHNP